MQYHNTEKMGYSASSLLDPRAFTNNPVDELPNNALWLISGEGKSPKEFFLAAVFKVYQAKTNCYDHPLFKNAAYGHGHIFGETIRLNGLSWFESFKKSMSNFKYGLCEIEEKDVIVELRKLAGRHAI